MGDGVVTEVPPQLKKLVRMVARAFYDPLHIACLDVLTNYPCVAEVDLVDILRMNGSQKQLRQVLGTLRKDKLVKSMQKMETDDLESNGDSSKHLKMIHYYYINYKEFVNVVKYKLDMMRKKIQSEGKTAHSRTVYICTTCHSTFTELDIDRLFDPSLSELCCSHCKSPLEEDVPESGVDTVSLMFRLNEQLKPIVDLLRETENIVLAPEVLEPTPQGIRKHMDGNLSRRLSAGGSASREWTSQSSVDMYGGNTTISVNIGEESQEKKIKEAPEWMRKSTVHTEAETSAISEDSSKADVSSHHQNIPDHQIMSHLLAHEGKESSVPAKPVEDEAEYSSSSDENLDEKFASEEESSEEEYTVRIGDQVVPVNEVTSDMLNAMNDEEKEHYRKVYQLAMSHAEFC